MHLIPLCNVPYQKVAFWAFSRSVCPVFSGPICQIPKKLLLLYNSFRYFASAAGCQFHFSFNWIPDNFMFCPLFCQHLLFNRINFATFTVFASPFLCIITKPDLLFSKIPLSFVDSLNYLPYNIDIKIT